MLLKPESRKSKAGCKQGLSVTCMCLATWGYTFTWQLPLWILGRAATASIFQAVNEAQQESASAESSDGKGAPPPTSMLQLLSRQARSSTRL